MPLLTLNLSCENVKYPERKHFEKTNISTYVRNISVNKEKNKRNPTVASISPTTGISLACTVPSTKTGEINLLPICFNDSMNW